MKRTLLIITLLLTMAVTAGAQVVLREQNAGAADIVDGVSVSNFNMDEDGAYFAIDMNIDMSKLDVSSNRAVLLTPRLVNGSDSIDLPAIGIYGRRRYYYYVRNGESMLSGGSEMVYRAKNRPESTVYHQVIPYKEWMNGSTLRLCRQDFGCCSDMLADMYGDLGYYERIFFPQLVYARPKGDGEKTYSLDRSAFVDFPVDQTVIYPEYRNNVQELGKIQATIDSICSDKDITITLLTLKGYASPESPYSHNADLATGRTAALKKYIQQLYNFREGLIATSSEPENWEGLRKYVELSNLEHKTEILEIINSGMEPDPKEAKIKKQYPEEYRFLLQNCYPALRRTDYRIKYTVRTFTDVEEIKRVMKENPHKLSLNEFYLLSEQYEPGSDEFSEVFETVVRMYPNEPSANLNAANAAMRRNDLKIAKKYIDKSGNSPEATYARASYYFLTEDYDTALGLFRQAEKAGVKEATETLRQFEGRKNSRLLKNQNKQ